MSGRPKLNVMLLGAKEAGKSALVSRFQFNKFIEKYEPTLGDEYNKEIEIRTSEFVSLKILDTPGEDQFGFVTDMQYTLADGFIIVFDLTSKKSFEMVDSYIGLIDKRRSHTQVPVLLVGNKKDLEDRRTVKTKDAAAKAVSLGAEYMESSAKENINVSNIFRDLAVAIVDKNSDKSSSSKNNKEKAKELKEKEKEREEKAKRFSLANEQRPPSAPATIEQDARKSLLTPVPKSKPVIDRRATVTSISEAKSSSFVNSRTKTDVDIKKLAGKNMEISAPSRERSSTLRPTTSTAPVPLPVAKKPAPHEEDDVAEELSRPKRSTIAVSSPTKDMNNGLRRTITAPAESNNLSITPASPKRSKHNNSNNNESSPKSSPKNKNLTSVTQQQAPPSPQSEDDDELPPPPPKKKNPNLTGSIRKKKTPVPEEFEEDQNGHEESPSKQQTQSEEKQTSKHPGAGGSIRRKSKQAQPITEEDEEEEREKEREREKEKEREREERQTSKHPGAGGSIRRKSKPTTPQPPKEEEEEEQGREKDDEPEENEADEESTQSSSTKNASNGEKKGKKGSKSGKSADGKDKDCNVM